MAGFLIVLPSVPGPDAAGELFNRGVHLAKQLWGSTAVDGVLRLDWVSTVTFSRANGSGGALVRDANTGSFVAVMGTWFHSSGYASGAEARLLKRLLEVGASLVANELEGFYSIAFGDGRTRELWVITDLVGSCHVFHRSLSPGVTVIGGSSLLLAALERCKLDPVGAQEFLNTGVVYEDRTCFEAVRKIGPALLQQYRNGRCVGSDTYWRSSSLRPNSLRHTQAVEELWGSLADAARKVCSAFPRVVCDLTGGYDSRAMVAAFYGSNLPVAVTVSGAADSADVRVSQGLAQVIGLTHRHHSPAADVSLAEAVDTIPLTDGEYDMFDYARIARVHRQSSQEFDVSVNGSFGEIARGYWWELLLPAIGRRQPIDAHLLAQKRYSVGQYESGLWPAEGRLDLTRHFKGVIERTNADLAGSPNTFQMDHAYLRMRMQRWQGRIASATNRLWPCLSPFMFRQVLEAMLKMGVHDRLRSLVVRRMLLMHTPLMARYPLEHGYPAMPLSLTNMHRFLPLVGYYGNRIVKRMKAAAGLKVQAPVSTKPLETDRLLPPWHRPELRAQLVIQDMRLGSILSAPDLQRFLATAQESTFPYGAQWVRVATLERVLEMLNRAWRS